MHRRSLVEQLREPVLRRASAGEGTDVTGTAVAERALDRIVARDAKEAKPGKPQDTVSATTGVSVEQATKDSVRAIMLIRSYRMRGHFHASRSMTAS